MQQLCGEGLPDEGDQQSGQDCEHRSGRFGGDGGILSLQAHDDLCERPFGLFPFAPGATTISGTPTQTGSFPIVVRATDSNKVAQPEKTPWNAKGYLNNGWHSVAVEVS